MMNKARLLCVSFVLFLSLAHQAQDKVYFGIKESVPTIPPKCEKLKVIIVSDASNEIDDVWAISLALLHPERFDILGFVGSNYDHTFLGIGPKSIQQSVETIETILEKAGLKGKYPVYPGGHPMQYEFFPSKSQGIDFIVQEALKCNSEHMALPCSQLQYQR